jgi:hypothetical protein
MHLLSVGLIASLLLVLPACSQADQRAAKTPAPIVSTATSGSPSALMRTTDGAAAAAEAGVLRTALGYVPDTAEVATLTDFDRFRDRFGVPDMTSGDLMTDRFRFWERADSTGVLLHEGRLRENSSELELDYGFTQDDVDWELAYTGGEVTGFVLGFRPDQDMTAVQRAVQAGVEPLAGATVLLDEHRLVSGKIPLTVEDSWADAPWVEAASAQPADSYYLRAGGSACIPLEETLGPDTTVEDQEQVLDRRDLRGLDDPEAVAIAFTGPRTALAMLAYDEMVDATVGEDRATLAEAWPRHSDRGVVWADGFSGAAALPSDGSSVAALTLSVRDPRTARSVVFADALPFAVCGDVRLLPEPTGL